MAVSNTSSTSSTSEPHALTPTHHTVTRAEWMEAIEQQRLERSTLNRLIINYLVTGKRIFIEEYFIFIIFFLFRRI